MARPSIAQLIAKHKERSEQKKGNSGNFENDVYPFFNIPKDTEAEIRILPDANEENELEFHIERYMHSLPINGKHQKIPCLQNYNQDCPICERSSKYYKVANINKENTKTANGELGPNAEKGKIYLKKKDDIIRALILRDPLPLKEGEESHVGKVRKLYLAGKVLNRIMGDLSSFGENDDRPWDLENGVNFIFRKTIQNDQADYSGSGFARKSTPIPAEYKDTVKLVDLKTLLPQNPGLERVLAFLEAHDTGKDVEGTPSSSNTTSTETKQSTNKVEEKFDSDDKIPFDATGSVAKPEVQAVKEPVKEEPKQAEPAEDDILARIKNRNKNKGA